MLPTPSLRTLAPPALSLAVSAAPAPAQTALERVLDQIGDATEVSGILANTADNNLLREITGTRIETTETTSSEIQPLTLQAFLDGEDTGVDPARVYIGETGGRSPDLVTLQDFFDSGEAVNFIDFYGGFAGFGQPRNPPPPDARILEIERTNTSGETIKIYVLGRPDGENEVASVEAVAAIAAAEDVPSLSLSDFNSNILRFPREDSTFSSNMTPSEFTLTTTEIIETEVSFTDIISGSIDASITNTVTGVAAQAATTGDVSVTEPVTALIGNLSTTALSAVNTGEITMLGANLDLSEDIAEAVAGTRRAVQQGIDATVTQVGTVSDQTMLAINSALNDSNVNASVLNAMSGVNATIGRSGSENALSDTNFTAVAGMDADRIAALTGGIETTALGAVNTGAIVSRANNDVRGIVSAIIGDRGAALR